MYCQKMDVILDVDATIYPLVDAIRTIPGGEACSLEICDTYGALPGMITPPHTFRDVLHDAQQYEKMMEIGYIPSAHEACLHLHEAGARLHVVTHREPEYRNDLIRFLNDTKFPYTSVECDYAINKIQAAQIKGAQLIIDDHPQTIQDAHAAGILIRSLRYRYNSEVLSNLGLKLCDTWDELLPECLDALHKAYALSLAA
jgi:hypothetical protein